MLQACQQADQEPKSRPPNVMEKMYFLKAKIEEWNKKKKEAFKTGKKSAARRLSRSISVASKQYNEISEVNILLNEDE